MKVHPKIVKDKYMGTGEIANNRMTQEQEEEQSEDNKKTSITVLNHTAQ